MRAVCSGTRGRGCCGWSDIAKPPEITTPTPLSTFRLTHSPTVSGDACDMPFTQAELADATGLSTVHVNRTLQELRGDGLITLRAGSLSVLDWDRLREAGEFNPTYLHLRKEAA